MDSYPLCNQGGPNCIFYTACFQKDPKAADPFGEGTGGSYLEGPDVGLKEQGLGKLARN